MRREKKSRETSLESEMREFRELSEYINNPPESKSDQAIKKLEESMTNGSSWSDEFYIIYRRMYYKLKYWPDEIEKLTDEEVASVKIIITDSEIIYKIGELIDGNKPRPSFREIIKKTINAAKKVLAEKGPKIEIPKPVEIAAVETAPSEQAVEINEVKLNKENTEEKIIVPQEKVKDVSENEEITDEMVAKKHAEIEAEEKSRKSSLNYSRENAKKNGLTDAQVDTIEKLQDEFNSKDVAAIFDSHRTGFISHVAVNYENFPHPALVGKNIVFSKDWLPYISGANARITPAQLAQLRDNLDKVYDSYVGLTGKVPTFGHKILIRLQPLGRTGETAHAHPNYNQVCLNVNGEYMKTFWQEVASGSWSSVLMHEMAHTFSFGNKWKIGQEGGESIAELLVAYALEDNKDAWYGIQGVKGPARELTRGSQHRMRNFGNAVKASDEHRITAFSLNPYKGCAFDFYLQGLVSKVGWDTYKKAFHSYNNGTFDGKSKFDFDGELQAMRAFDLFERIAYFSNNPKTVLYSLPDRGKLLKAFNIKIEKTGSYEKDIAAIAEEIKRIKIEIDKETARINKAAEDARGNPEKQEALLNQFVGVFTKR
jgi:hypothetical protein